MIRITNDHLGRALHAVLYTRLFNFCAKYTPEAPAEGVVATWLSRVYTNDTYLHVLATLDESYNVIEHAVIDVQQVYNNVIVYCHQLERDTASLESMDEFMEFLDKLAEIHNASCIMFTIADHSKAFEKRYGYQAVRALMMKSKVVNGYETA